MNEQYKGRSKAAMAARRELAERGLKYCGRCENVKEVREFRSDKTKWDGLSSRCRECKAETNQKWNEENKERRAELARKWYEENKERVAETNRKWNEQNKERVAEINRKWNEENKERRAELARKWKEANKERHTETTRKWNVSTAMFRTWEKKLAFLEPDMRKGSDGILLVPCEYCGKMHAVTNQQVQSRIQSANTVGKGESCFYCSQGCKDVCPKYGLQVDPYAEKKEGERIEVPKAIRLEVYRRADWKCERCGDSENKLEIHHEIPVSRDPSRQHDLDNLMLLCWDCHRGDEGAHTGSCSTGRLRRA